MKTILCLLAVLCVVNASLIQQVMEAEQDVEGFLEGQGIDVELLKGELMRDYNMGKAAHLTDEQMLETAEEFFLEGCDTGFSDLPEGKEALKVQLVALCDVLEDVKNKAAAAGAAPAQEGEDGERR